MRTVEYSYKVIVPSGNDTALVLGEDFTKEQRRHISKSIMEAHSNVEQVGFVSNNCELPVFSMVEEDFCGNGTRAAVFHYLNGKPGEIRITIPGIVKDLCAGISEELEVWTEVPLHPLPEVEKTSEGLYVVRLPGVTHLIIPPNQKEFIPDDQEYMKSLSVSLLSSYGLFSKRTCGAVFVGKKANKITIYPFVHDYGVDTMILETACGSGTIAIAILNAVIQQSSVVLPVYQPSGGLITATVHMNNGKVTKAIISGKVRTDNRIHYGTLSIDD